MYAFTGDVLFAIYRRGLRRGNWKDLKESERAFSCLLIDKLNETGGMRIWGFEKAIEILRECENFGLLNG